MKKRLALAVAFTALVAACGSDDTEPAATQPAADAPDATTADAGGGDKATIKLVVNPWSASRLNVEVAKNIIENELGNPVEVVEVNENDAMFTGLSDGSVDAALEIWPSGITDEENAFFENGTVVKLGDLGAVGRIGWFVPSYVLESNPELATWEGFTKPEAGALFATAETGGLGRFLATDPSYSQFDEQIIANLEMPFQVQYSGSEPATIAEVDAKVAANEPVVLYWWTPTAAVAKYDLQKIELPAVTDECNASAASSDGGYACDYPEDVLLKAASAQLAEKAPDVFAFLQNFTMTADDQLEMLPAYEIDGEDPAEVAARWVAAHEDTWRTWLS